MKRTTKTGARIARKSSNNGVVMNSDVLGLASYCSKTCQHADWPTHKSTCQSKPPRNKDLTAPESFASVIGPCSDATRALLSEKLDWNGDASLQAWSLSLAEGARRAAAWSSQQHRSSLGINMPAPPQWLLHSLSK